MGLRSNPKGSSPFRPYTTRVVRPRRSFGAHLLSWSAKRPVLRTSFLQILLASSGPHAVGPAGTFERQPRIGRPDRTHPTGAERRGALMRRPLTPPGAGTNGLESDAGRTAAIADGPRSNVPRRPPAPGAPEAPGGGSPGSASSPGYAAASRLARSTVSEETVLRQSGQCHSSIGGRLPSRCTEWNRARSWLHVSLGAINDSFPRSSFSQTPCLALFALPAGARLPAGEHLRTNRARSAPRSAHSFSSRAVAHPVVERSVTLDRVRPPGRYRRRAGTKRRHARSVRQPSGRAHARSPNAAKRVPTRADIPRRYRKRL